MVTGFRVYRVYTPGWLYQGSVLRIHNHGSQKIMYPVLWCIAMVLKKKKINQIIAGSFVKTASFLWFLKYQIETSGSLILDAVFGLRSK